MEVKMMNLTQLEYFYKVAHSPNRIQSRCNWSPLEGHTFHWRVERTFCNGFPIYNRGHVTDEKFRGQAVCFNR